MYNWLGFRKFGGLKLNMVFCEDRNFFVFCFYGDIEGIWNEIDELLGGILLFFKRIFYK